MDQPYPPNVELLAVAWLKSLDGIPTGGVATTLPADPATWSQDGFVQVTSVGGSPAVHTPLRRPVVQLDTWANNPNSLKPPWGRASALMETIIWGCYQLSSQQRMFVLPHGFGNARLLTAWPVTEPRRVPADESGFARYTCDLTMVWTTA
ncbi:MAG: hypothetical protein M3460_04555 [Actinomycetota bacterium]|nr:hypothetical protein [Actinomycetota bacterium]